MICSPLIAEGLAADIVAFDYDALTANATFSKPSEVSQGMRHVIVNGKHVLKDGKQTDELPGRVLRGPGYREETASYAVSTGQSVEPLDSFDRMMRGFMKQHRVPGASLAVTDRGRLVFARGFGYADVATRAQVTSESLFRIASISKPITAVAILQLAEQGKLTLDDKVFDILDYQADIKNTGDRFDVRQREITVRHLLQHRGGWDRSLSFDAHRQDASRRSASERSSLLLSRSRPFGLSRKSRGRCPVAIWRVVHRSDGFARRMDRVGNGPREIRRGV